MNLFRITSHESRITAIAVAAVLAVIASLAYASSVNHFSGQGATTSVGKSVIVPGKGGQAARLTYIRYANGSDVAPALNIRDCAAGTLVSANASGAATNILTVASGGTAFASNDVVVVYDVSTASDQTPVYERALVHTSTASSVTLSGNTTLVPAAGDVIYEASTVATLPIVTGSTSEVSAVHGFFHGTDGRPILIDCVSTNGGAIFVLSADYGNP